MKVTTVEVAPCGQKCLNLRANAKELIILRELLKNAKTFMPKTPETETTYLRVKQMVKTLNKANLEGVESEWIPKKSKN